jgi:hypothetical protein
VLARDTRYWSNSLNGLTCCLVPVIDTQYVLTRIWYGVPATRYSLRGIWYARYLATGAQLRCTMSEVPGTSNDDRLRVGCADGYRG